MDASACSDESCHCCELYSRSDRNPERSVKSCHGPSTVMPVYMVGLAHLSFLAFSTDERDWFHHILFVDVMSSWLSLETRPLKIFSPFSSAATWRIDHALLFLMKHNMIHKLTEKKWNARINVWMRSSGCFPVVQ